MSDVLHEEIDGVHRVTLNRPDKLNALTDEMMRHLPGLLGGISRDPAARAVIITGAGDAFCAGADLGIVRERQQTDDPGVLPDPVGRETELLADCEIPVITVVNGVAAGAGMGLACMSDYRIMEEGAYFMEAHAAIGLTPTAMAWYLPRLIGFARANELVLTGRRVDAAEAMELGLINELVPAGHGLDSAKAFTAAIKDLSPMTVRATKRVMRLVLEGAPLDQIRSTGSLLNRVAKRSGTQVGGR